MATVTRNDTLVNEAEVVITSEEAEEILRDHAAAQVDDLGDARVSYDSCNPVGEWVFRFRQESNVTKEGE